jgi:hypothetical protein
VEAEPSLGPLVVGPSAPRGRMQNWFFGVAARIVSYGLALVARRSVSVAGVACRRRKPRLPMPHVLVWPITCEASCSCIPGSPRGASSCPASAARAVHPQGLPLLDASRRPPRLRRRLLTRQAAAPCPSPPATCEARRGEPSRSHAPLSSRMCPSGRPLFLLLPPPGHGMVGGEGRARCNTLISLQILAFITIG